MTLEGVLILAGVLGGLLVGVELGQQVQARADRLAPMVPTVSGVEKWQPARDKQSASALASASSFVSCAVCSFDVFERDGITYSV